MRGGRPWWYPLNLPTIKTSFLMKYIGLFRWRGSKESTFIILLIRRQSCPLERKTLQPDIDVPVEPLQAIQNYFAVYFGHAPIGSLVGNERFCWAVVCRQTSLRGLGIINMDKFARDLRHRWSLLEWMAPERPWVGMENLCNKEDLALF